SWEGMFPAPLIPWASLHPTNRDPRGECARVAMHREIGPWSTLRAVEFAATTSVLAPGAARLDVDRGVLGTFCQVEAGIDAEPPCHEIAESHATGRDDARFAEGT